MGWRRRVSSWIQAGLPCLIALLGCGPDAEAPGDGAPDLVLVYLIDTLRADHLGVYGYARDTSPEIDAFARDAVLFEQAHSAAPWTKASVASLFTGLLPAYTDATEKHQRLPQRLDTLAEVFSRAGWRTAGFVTNPWVTATFGFDQGFDHYRDVTSEGSILLASADDVNAALLPWLGSLSSGERHFVYVHVRDPHSPYAPPAPFDTLFDPDYRGALDPLDFDWRLDLDPADRRHLVALYDGEIRFADRAFGRLLDFLKQRGLYRRALIVLTSDHGEEFLDHGRWEHGRDLYQTLIHVPLLIRLPGGAHAGTRVAQSVSLLDLFPTLTGAAGIESDASRGRSLLQPEAGSARGPVIAQESRLERELFSVRDGRFKLIHESAPAPRVRLFDLSEDPGEQRDLAAREPERVSALTAFAQRALRSSNEGLNLRFFGDGRPHRVAGRLTTTGRVELAEGYQLRADDTLEIERDAKGVRFEIGLAPNQPFRIDARDPNQHEFIDERGLRVVIRPPHAELALAIELDGAALPPKRLRLGPAREAAPAVPLVLRGDDPRIAQAEPLLPLNPAYRHAIPVHARLWRVEEPAHEEAVLTDELEQRLRALGYLDP